jgi:flagellar hook-length control protein FliK
MKIMVDLPPVMLSKEATTTAPQRDSDPSRSKEFNELFKQSVNKVAMPESGIKKPEHGEILPNNSFPMITLESKVLRGGMLLLVGGDEPTNDVIEEFAQSQGVEAELLALLMKDPSSVSQTRPTPINSAQQVSLLSNEASLSKEKIPRAMDLLSGSVKETAKQSTLHTAIPSKFIVSESMLSTSMVTQTQTVQNSALPLNLESTRLGGVDDDGILIQAKNTEPPLALMDVTGKRTSVHTLDGKSLLSEEKIPRAMDLLSGTVKETAKQNTLHTAIPSKFIASESLPSKSTATQPQAMQNSILPLNRESTRLGGVDDDGILIQAKNAEPPAALMDVTGKRNSVHTLDGKSLLSEEKIPRAMDLLSGSVKETPKQNTLHTAIPSKFIASETRLSTSTVTQTKNAEPPLALMDVTGNRNSVHSLDGKSLLSEEKIPRAMDLLSGSVKETPKQNTLHAAIPSKFIASESLPSKSMATQPQAVQNATLPLNVESTRLGGVDDDGILIQAKNAEPPAAPMDITGKRFSIERPDEVLIIKQEQHADMSKRLSEALGQRLTAQIAKGVWQVELDIHPKSLGRIEIHLEMRGGELEAYFNASKALTRELLQDGIPRLKEELREHGIETAYLGLGSGKQGANDGNSTPFGSGDDEEDLDMAACQAKTAMLEPTVGPVKQQSLIEGLDITI